MNTLQCLYLDTIVNQLKEQFGYASVMEVPKLDKITINMGLGEAIENKKVIDSAVSDLQAITGQKPIVTKARKSIATFKVRTDWPIGCKVTLRKARMYDFLQRLICIAIPRVRDFRGLKNNSFDGQGNYSMGLREQIVFPEINYDQVDALRGMDITITTTAKTDKEARALLKAFNFPFKEDKS
ncbi:MAG: 50S ribosomal protein L5 [Legionellaceae bacterium]